MRRILPFVLAAATLPTAIVAPLPAMAQVVVGVGGYYHHPYWRYHGYRPYWHRPYVYGGPYYYDFPPPPPAVALAPAPSPPQPIWTGETVVWLYPGVGR